jgi:hypothetical protein
MAEAAAWPPTPVRLPWRRMSPARPAALWHDLLLVVAIALPDSLALYTMLGRETAVEGVAAGAAALLPATLAHSVPTAMLLAAVARWLAARRQTGWRRAAAVVAVVIGLVAVRVALWLADAWFPVPGPGAGGGSAGAPTALLLVLVTVTVAPFVVVYESRRARREWATRRLLALRAAQREAERHVAAARLRSLQGRIDPFTLQRLLGAVAETHPRDAARAETLLDSLIAYLRLATSSTRERRPTLVEELALASAYLRLRRLGGLPSLALDGPVGAAGGAAVLPPGIVLAALDDQLRDDATPTVVLRIEPAAARLRLHFDLPAGPSAAALARMRALAEDGGAIVAVAPAGAGARLTVEVPDERR